MVIYGFREDRPIVNRQALDPQRMGETVARVRAVVAAKENKGEPLERGDALPRVILREVERDGAEHPFWPVIEHDQAKAAEKWNLHSIRRAIGSLVIMRAQDDGEPRPAFLHIGSSGDAVKPAYRSTTEIIGAFSLQIATLRRAERDLEAFRRRYAALAEICEGVAKLEDRVREMRARLESEAAAGRDLDLPPATETRASA